MFRFFNIKPSSGYELIPDMLPTYFENNYRLKATLLGTNLLPDDGFILKTETCWSFNIIMFYLLMF